MIYLALALAAAAEPCPPKSESLTTEDPRLTSDTLIVVKKAARQIMLYEKGTLASHNSQPLCFKVGLGGAPSGHKYREGDQRTPEGWYRTSDKPWSQFYGAIAVHYPNTNDIQAGVKAGVVSSTLASQMTTALQKDDKPYQRSTLGGEILVHGGGSQTDWTLGCVAVNNSELDLIRSRLPKSMVTDILILP